MDFNFVFKLIAESVKNNPAVVPKLVRVLLDMADGLPGSVWDGLPDGPFKEWAKANEAQAMETTKAVLTLLEQNPGLVIALVGQFWKR